RDLTHPGQDPRTGGVDGLGAGGAGGVRRGDRGAVPTERLGERRPRDIAGVAVAHGLATHGQVDVGPRDARVVERGTRGGDAVLDERVAPLAPGVHADTEDGDLVVHFDSLVSTGSTDECGS